MHFKLKVDLLSFDDKLDNYISFMGDFYSPLRSNILICFEFMEATSVRGANPHQDTLCAISPMPSSAIGRAGSDVACDTPSELTKTETVSFFSFFYNNKHF